MGTKKYLHNQHQNQIMALENNPVKKYPVGCDVDKEIIFNFSYLLHKETVSYIGQNGHVMFIVRGPPSTGKATLSEMLGEKYPEAVYCCADKYFTNSFANAQRTRDSLKASHTYCQKKVEEACEAKVHTIIVQNTHMRKWEMQIYLDFAAIYDYTVIMAITLYRFDCTPMALAENNTDGLDINYFRKRLAQWEDVMPLFTGWFISPEDSIHLLHHLRQSLEVLLSDGKFCRVFNAYDSEEIMSYFKLRKSLFCTAAFIKNYSSMKKYYLSDQVQTSYGKCFSLMLLGYLVTPATVYSIVSCDAKPYLSRREAHREGQELVDTMEVLRMSTNLQHKSQTLPTPFPEQLPNSTTVELEENEHFKIETCLCMEMANKDSKILDIEGTQQFLDNVSETIVNLYGNTHCDTYVRVDVDTGDSVYRLNNDIWLIKPQQKILVKSVFTGFYE